MIHIKAQCLVKDRAQSIHLHSPLYPKTSVMIIAKTMLKLHQLLKMEDKLKVDNKIIIRKLKRISISHLH